MNVPLNQMPNPTKEQRHEMLRDALEREGRSEDFDYITHFLSPPNEITTITAPGVLQGAKIGILGGGVAGMAAAFELRKLGADITILEASEDRIGGRIYTYYYEPSRTYFGEFGAMRIPISHETTWYYIDLLGLDTVSMTSPRRNNFIYVHNTRIRTTQSIEEYLYPFFDLTPQERNTPWSELSEYAFQYAFRILPADIRAELIQVLPEYSPQILALMNISLRQNFEELGLSQGAIQLLSGIDSAAGALLHNSYTEYAHEDYSLDFINIYQIKGGNVNLPLAFYESFLSESPSVYSDIDSSSLGKVIYKSGHRVTGIYQSNYRNKIIIRYTNTFDMTESADIFDYVICSLPFSALRTVEIKPYLSNIKMQAITEVYYANAQKTQFFCNRRFWERNTDYGNIIGGISFTDLPIQSS
ncbi:FAD-dependent oxidoreductase [Lachnospiraceae bacterium MD1]|uniref:FAD-dependent oxidoreductase n=1 Tax=Variimorphobacter saccharofermentans TaxID=2755051 RepID=A0A839K3Z7_9FIRM|nr:FAD-dependent oxidoreductase [Variimorphobacter saccharofermentans]MBB2184346.1 FAD-dependent oxidoreductase [Variimorphobacter saccharofermentans]